MRAIFCGLKYDYGRPELGLSVEFTNFYDALSKMPGVEAEFFGIDEHTLLLGKEAANKLLLKTVREKQPDLLFCYLLDAELDKSVIGQITREGKTKTFNWFADDHWRVPVFSRYFAPLFTAVSTTDSDAPALYKKYGITNVIKTQWGANHNLYKPIALASPDQNLQVTFVGKKYGRRPEYIKSLQRAGVPAKGFGGGWSGGRVDFNRMLEIFSNSKINLNFSETYLIGLKAYLKLLAKFVVAKEGGIYKLVVHHPVNNFRAALGSQKRPIKGRTFEVPATGGFLLTQECDDDITEYFVPGKEIVVFKDVPDLIEKCQYYLEHEGERQKIAKAGFERTMRDHTYQQRFGQIFKAMGLM